jgi:hypothetical protein
MVWTNTSPITFGAGESFTLSPNITSFALYSASKPPMSRKKARKAYTAAEEDFYTAKAAIETAEREADVQRAAMEDARTRMDVAARILAAK